MDADKKEHQRTETAISEIVSRKSSELLAEISGNVLKVVNDKSTGLFINMSFQMIYHEIMAAIISSKPIDGSVDVDMTSTCSHWMKCALIVYSMQGEEAHPENRTSTEKVEAIHDILHKFDEDVEMMIKLSMQG